MFVAEEYARKHQRPPSYRPVLLVVVIGEDFRCSASAGLYVQ